MKAKEPQGFIELGEYFGYPPCCIAEFIQFVLDHMQGKNPIREKRKLSGTGYVPCALCNKKPVEELISTINANRKAPKDFAKGISIFSKVPEAKSR